jgi:hypothetical protein
MLSMEASLDYRKGLLTWGDSLSIEQTQRAPGLLGLSPTYARTQVMHPLYQAVCAHFLTTHSWFWWGNERKESVSKPYVHSCTAARIGVSCLLIQAREAKGK